jgi:hypothetical protein
MKIYVELSLDADIIEVPDMVAVNIHKYRDNFLDWMYDKNNHHKYWTKFRDGKGGWSEGVCYDTEAFVDWLNENVIVSNLSPAVFVERGLDVDACPEGMIEIFF